MRQRFRKRENERERERMRDIVKQILIKREKEI